MIAGISRLLLASIWSISLSALNAQDGTLDPTFDQDGILITPGVGYGASAIAVQLDDRVLFARPTVDSDFGLMRFLPNGELDNTFGSTGQVQTSITPYIDQATAIAVQTDGKILLAGDVFEPNQIRTMAIVRYNPDGELDASFGTAGIERLQVNAAWDRAVSVDVDDQGRILLAGNISIESHTAMFCARMQSDGLIDSSFANNGFQVMDMWNYVGTLVDMEVVQSGSILLGGIWDGGGAVVRLLDDGTIDSTFADQGAFYWDPTIDTPHLTALAQREDGRVVLVGSTSLNTGQEVLIAQLLANGLLDYSFGTDGYRIVELDVENGASLNVALQNDGKIVLGGFVAPTSLTFDPLVLRLTSTGDLDGSFGTGGITVTTTAPETPITGMVLDSEQRILLGGIQIIGPPNAVIARYSNGQIQSTEELCTPLDFAIKCELRNGQLFVSSSVPMNGRLMLIDIRGRIHRIQNAMGRSVVAFPETGLAPGMYFMVLDSPDARATAECVIP